MRWDPITRMFRPLEKGGGTSTTTQQNFSPEEAAARARVQSEAERIYGATAGTIANAPYPGAKPVPFSADTNAARDYLRSYATGAGAQSAGNANSYSNFLMGGAQYAESNPYLQSAINAAIRPVTQQFTDSGGVMQGIRQNAMGAGQAGGSRQGVAEGIAAGRYADVTGDIAARMSNENYQNALRAGTQALALSPQTYNLGMAPGGTLGALGAQGEMLSQEQEQYAADSRNWQLNAPWAPLQNYANIVFGGSSPGTTATQSGPQGPSRMQSALGGAAMGAAMGASMSGPAAPYGAVIGGGIGLLAGLLS